MYELITPPAVEPFSLTDLKTALRVDHSNEDDLLMRLGITARAFIERRLGHAIALQTWRLTYSGQPSGPLTLRPGQVSSVTDVALRYGQSAYASTTDFSFCESRPATVTINAPGASDDGILTGVQVIFAAGRSDVSTTPPELIEAILSLAAHYYENREAVGEGRYIAMPLKVESLLAGLREVSL